MKNGVKGLAAKFEQNQLNNATGARVGRDLKGDAGLAQRVGFANTVGGSFGAAVREAQTRREEAASQKVVEALQREEAQRKEQEDEAATLALIAALARDEAPQQGAEIDAATLALIEALQREDAEQAAAARPRF